MAKTYKVSLFDDRTEGKRTEIGLNTNNGFIFITQDYDKAREAFHNEIQWLNDHCTASNLREQGDPSGISVNIASSWNLDRWNWDEQSFRDYIL